MIKINVQAGYEKAVMNILSEALSQKKKLIKIAMRRTQNNLNAFEKKYKMTSRTFYSKYTKGQLGDDLDFMEWAGEQEIIQRLKQEYKQIEGIHFAH